MERKTRRQQIVELLQDTPKPIPIEDITTTLGMTVSNVRTILNILNKQGYSIILTETKDGKGYQLVSSPEMILREAYYVMIGPFPSRAQASRYTQILKELGSRPITVFDMPMPG